MHTQRNPVTPTSSVRRVPTAGSGGRTGLPPPRSARASASTNREQFSIISAMRNTAGGCIRGQYAHHASADGPTSMCFAPKSQWFLRQALTIRTRMLAAGLAQERLGLRVPLQQRAAHVLLQQQLRAKCYHT